MKKNNIIKDKSFHFAVRSVNLYKTLSNERKEFILCKQFVRSGTSIGANVREGINAESDADFAHKLSISQKECDESCYWLELLKATDYISEKEFDSMYKDADELLKILKSIIISTKNKKIAKNS
jgi:four helix bundle protein